MNYDRQNTKHTFFGHIYTYCKVAGSNLIHVGMTGKQDGGYTQLPDFNGTIFADLPTLTHCAWVSRICVLFPPRIAILTHKIRRKVRIFSCITVYFPYILRKLPISRVLIANSRIDRHHITRLSKNRSVGRSAFAGSKYHSLMLNIS